MNRNNKKKILCILIVLFIVLITGVGIYAADYYHTTVEGLEYLESCSLCSVSQNGRLTVFDPGNARTGLIFYPGGKVEATAYAPILHRLSDDGVLCVLVKMPFNLAVFDQNAADGIRELYPEVENWYIGGHSLGGAMASYYLEDHLDDFKGLILMASYSTKELSSSGLKCLSVYGSEDLVINRRAYNESRSNLPADTTEVEIPGGNHENFGAYGHQKGDGEARITPEEQWNITEEEILKLMGP